MPCCGAAPLSLSLSLAFSHTDTHTLSLIYTRSRTHSMQPLPHSLPHSRGRPTASRWMPCCGAAPLSLSLSLSLLHTHSLSLTLCLSRTHALSFSLSHTLSHTHSHALCHTLSVTPSAVSPTLSLQPLSHTLPLAGLLLLYHYAAQS